MKPEWAAKHIADLMREAKHTVVFTGAGMSTESGLPDFRSNGGLWDGKDPMKVSHVSMLEEEPSTVTNFYRERIRDAKAHGPNRGHQILAEWETQGRIMAIATQNIDTYHQRAGSKNVYELHGNLDVRCSWCDKIYDGQFYLDRPNHEDLICTEEWEEVGCDGLVRPNVVMFGEMLPEDVFSKANRHFDKADLCIILGTSCSVYPAAGLPYKVYSRGGNVVIINRTPTELDYAASYIINDWDISKALTKIDKLLRE